MPPPPLAVLLYYDSLLVSHPHTTHKKPLSLGARSYFSQCPVKSLYMSDANYFSITNIFIISQYASFIVDVSHKS